LLFIASFDFFGSTDDTLLFDDRGESIGDGGKAGIIAPGDFKL
jgi:hypothetical protein